INLTILTNLCKILHWITPSSRPGRTDDPPRGGLVVGLDDSRSVCANVTRPGPDRPHNAHLLLKTSSASRTGYGGLGDGGSFAAESLGVLSGLDRDAHQRLEPLPLPSVPGQLIGDLADRQIQRQLVVVHGPCPRGDRSLAQSYPPARGRRGHPWRHPRRHHVALGGSTRLISSPLWLRSPLYRVSRGWAWRSAR